MAHMKHIIETNEVGGNRSTRRKPTTSGGSRTHAHVKHSGAQSAALTTRLPTRIYVKQFAMLSIYVVPWLTGMLAISSFHGTKAHLDLIMGNMGMCPEPPQM